MAHTRKKPFTKNEFDEIYSRVPRLTVEAILRSDDGGIWLAKRITAPEIGSWHTTGGTVYMREKLIDTVTRIAAEELQITSFTCEPKLLGIIEYDFHGYDGNPVSIAYEIQTNQVPQDGLDGAEVVLFHTLPENTIPEQRKFLCEQFGFA